MLMMAELYDALKEAGASDAKAREAARAIAQQDERFQSLQTDVSVMKWMLGFNLAMTTAILFKVFV